LTSRTQNLNEKFWTNVNFLLKSWSVHSSMDGATTKVSADRHRGRFCNAF